MRLLSALALLATLASCPVTADVGGSPVPCDQATAALACQHAAMVWGFMPSGGIAVLGDRIRLVGVEVRPGDDRMVILDLALEGGGVLAVVALPPATPLASVVEVSPDGSVLLLMDPVQDDPQTDTIPPQTLVVLDATGRQIGQASGLAVSAMADAFGENRIRFAPGQVSLDLSPLGGAGMVEVVYAKAEVSGAALIPDGVWLYDALLGRDRGWYQDADAIVATYARDGHPSQVVRRAGGAEEVLIAPDTSTPATAYGADYFDPVLSPDGTRLAVLQMGEAAPGPILLVLDMATRREVWRGSVGQHQNRRPLYRWTAVGALVVVQPHPTLDDLGVVTVFSPGP